MPLHPFLVHLPIALALLMPILAAAALVAGWRGWLPVRRVWAAVVALQALLLAGVVVALRSGEAEEERVEAIVSESSLEQHEVLAQRLLIVTGMVLLVAALPLVLRSVRRARAAALLAIFGMLTVTALALQTGKAGGELAYRHGAAAAYTSTIAPDVPASGNHEREGSD